MRKFLVCGNWKLHHSAKQTGDMIGQLKTQIGHLSGVDVAVAPVATTLWNACERAHGSSLRIAAQNVFYEEQGAFTGEWSTSHLLELGCDMCIVGHSERRQFFGESDESVAKKVQACLKAQIAPIACIGETLDERKAGHVESILKRQLEKVLAVIDVKSLAKVAIAYEPIWAIGTGIVATNAEIKETHLLIRKMVQSHFGDSASQMRLLYGGSVKPDNAFDIMMQEHVDGLLVGGASLLAKSFMEVLNASQKAFLEKAKLSISGL